MLFRDNFGELLSVVESMQERLTDLEERVSFHYRYFKDQLTAEKDRRYDQINELDDRLEVFALSGDLEEIQDHMKDVNHAIYALLRFNNIQTFVTDDTTGKTFIIFEDESMEVVDPLDDNS